LRIIAIVADEDQATEPRQGRLSPTPANSPGKGTQSTRNNKMGPTVHPDRKKEEELASVQA